METIGNYELIESLGKGSTSEVFLAKDIRNGREAALKRLHPQFINPKSIKRLKDEKSLISILKHQSIVEVFEVESSEHGAYLSMEYINGGTLSDFLKRGEILYPEIAVILMLDILEGVEYAHRNGVIHRDLKPDNIMLTSEGRPKIADFGLAKTLDRERLTQTGALVGSPVYMSPEQALSLPIDGRSDLFAIGIILYELCTGKLPFECENPHATLKKIIDVESPRPDSINPKVNRELSQIILQALAKKPEDRQSGVWELAYQLKDYLHNLNLLEERFSFSRFIKDRNNYLIEISKLLSETLFNRASYALKINDSYQFLIYIDHLLAIAPEHKDGKALLSKFHERSRLLLRKPVKLIFAAILLLLVVGATLWQFRLYSNPGEMNKPIFVTKKPEVVAPKVIDEIVSQPEKIEAKTEVKAEAKVETKTVTPTNAVKPIQKVLATPAAPQQKMGFVKLNVDYDVEVEIDGKFYDWQKENTAKLGVGTHRVTLKKPGFSPINNLVVVKAGETAVVNAKIQQNIQDITDVE